MNIINGQEQDIKLVPMCLNCMYCNVEDYTCTNEENKKAASEKFKEKIIASLPEGYDIDTLQFELKPVPLRAPQKKCGRHTVDVERIMNYILPESSRTDVDVAK